MIAKVWFRFTAFLRFLFAEDPVEAYFNYFTRTTQECVTELKVSYKEQVSYYEANNLILRQMIDDKNSEIQRLNDKIINLLSPKEETYTIEEVLTPPSTFTGRGWDAQRNRLEDIAARKSREEVLRTIAERENEVEELLKNQPRPVIDDDLGIGLRASSTNNF